MGTPGPGRFSRFQHGGIFWTPYGGASLFAADFRKDAVQSLSTFQSSTGFYRIPGFNEPDFNLSGPLDVAADLSGYSYIADPGNRRAVRCDPFGSYVQRINVEADAYGDTLMNPVTIAADDSLVFIGDARQGFGSGTGRVIRYKRRI